MLNKDHKWSVWVLPKATCALANLGGPSNHWELTYQILHGGLGLGSWASPLCSWLVSYSLSSWENKNTSGFLVC